MSEHDPTLWEIHAGRIGEADSLFLKRNVIAIGWDAVGDVSSIGGKREVKMPLRKTLFKYKLHQDLELFEKAYGYIREYY